MPRYNTLVDHGFHGGSSKEHWTRQTLQTVDDTDPSVMYIGEWNALQWSEAFNSTMHDTKAAGAAIEYGFTGSSISVFGSVGMTAKYGTPVSTYTLDDSPSVTFTAPQVTGSDPLNNVLFFSANNISPGDHTLIIRRASTDSATYFFDFMQVIPFGHAPALVSTSVSSSLVSITTELTDVSPSDSPSSSSTNEPTTPSQAPSSSPPQTSVNTDFQETSAPPELPVSTPTSSISQPLPSSSTQKTQLSASTLAPSANVTTSDLPLGSNILTSPTTTTSPIFDVSAHNASNTKYVVAGAVMGVFILLAAMVITFVVRRQRKKRSRPVVSVFQTDRMNESGEPLTPHHSDTPIMKESTLLGHRAVSSYFTELSTETGSVYSTQTESIIHDASADPSSRYCARWTPSEYALVQEDTHVDFQDTIYGPQIDDFYESLPNTQARDTDGGIRLAGGPPGAASDEPDLLPPAYSPTFGQRRELE
ncbi:hypothetical protein BDY19DRAFT_908785 [Irpex rosettiformis]|uniref:Uncharacterized protein n=1 Tax=Irpex rosettiformis TaxID=378272 RepID=A0ACB8TUY4_9APHY|nr:hypothetical protein BDY19DRAFT_908785 [Irpex rosettiformis]